MDDTPRPEFAIRARGLRRSYRTRRAEVVAVAGIDLDVEQAEIFGFLGPNGAGKTTTLRMLSTLVPPTAGQATVAGYDLRRDPRRVREHIGYVGQAGGTDHSLTARAELVFQGRLYRLSPAQARRRADELLRAFDLEGAADRAIGTYSGGQRRRLDIALGLVHRPELLFLDEPTTGLDPQSRARTWDEVKRLREVGTTVFLTTHYLEEADALCDRLAIIDRGRIVAEGTPDELKREIAGDVITLGVAGDPGVALDVLTHQPFIRDHDPLSAGGGPIRVYVDQGETAMPAIFRVLDQAGVGLRTVGMSRPSLDDVFLRQTGRSLREEAA
ncbi:MAG TPA: ATP-binding cassette domain-containing protein [Candidatus Dormibacteraeota bacterium]|nr:ATP-binding cassette domain-containing protein [Candidatus Dormibacteraeota bacterium]